MCRHSPTTAQRRIARDHHGNARECPVATGQGGVTTAARRPGTRPTIPAGNGCSGSCDNGSRDQLSRRFSGFARRLPLCKPSEEAPSAAAPYQFRSRSRKLRGMPCRRTPKASGRYDRGCSAAMRVGAQRRASTARELRQCPHQTAQKWLDRPLETGQSRDGALASSHGVRGGNARNVPWT